VGAVATVNAVAVSADGYWMASAANDGTAAIVDVRAGRERARACPGDVKDVALSPDGHLVATGEEHAKLYDDGAFATWGGITVWAAEPSVCAERKESGAKPALAFARDGELVARATGARPLALAVTAEELALVDVEAPVELRRRADGQTLVRR